MASREFANSVYNKKRRVWFGTLVSTGWFSAAPDDIAVNRAIRTNNPGALNVSGWQRTRPGYVGQTKPDGAGNITTIYQTPEDGVAAWYYLLSEVYGFKTAGEFDLTELAKKYAGPGASGADVQSYLDGWSKWSNRVLTPTTIVHLSNESEMLALAQAEFAHEADATTPLHEDQILYGFHSHPGSVVSRKRAGN
jgi:D-alanyl-D-alanine carboxypeptidase